MSKMLLGRTLALTGLALLASPRAELRAQSIYATLTGVVSDPSQAVLPSASVKLRDELSGSQRDTTTNNEGYYTFVSVPPGTYSLIIESKGFEGYRETGIALGGGERRNVNATLQVGNATVRST